MSTNFQPENYAEFLNNAKQASSLGRGILLDYFGNLSQVGSKDKAGLVTEADMASEKAICSYLRDIYPEIPIMAEEQEFSAKQKTPLANTENLWMIDPLDGTTNFVHQFPIFCISIGLKLNGKLVMGLVEAPLMRQTYTAVLGGGAFLNGEPIKVSERQDFSESLLATGFFTHENSVLQEQLELFANFISQTRGVRRAGSAAYDLCQVAQGVFDGYWESNLSPWDTAAGTLIVREAGGIVTNYEGEEFVPEMKTILAANKSIHKKMHELL